VSRPCNPRPAARVVRSWIPGLRGAPSRLGLLAFALATPAVAQDTPDPAAGDAGPPPSVAETLDFVNTQLQLNASPWRPCRASARLELGEDRTVRVVITRGSYCEDTRIEAPLGELDPGAISWEAANEILVRLPCKDDAACARHYQRRKTRNTGDWGPRDDEWLPDGPAGVEHMQSAIELPMGSRTDKATELASALKYLIKAASVDPTYAKPADRFAREPSAPTADGGT